MRVNTSVVDDAFSDGIFQQLLSQFSHVELGEYYWILVSDIVPSRQDIEFDVQMCRSAGASACPPEIYEFLLKCTKTNQQISDSWMCVFPWMNTYSKLEIQESRISA